MYQYLHLKPHLHMVDGAPAPGAKAPALVHLCGSAPPAPATFRHFRPCLRPVNPLRTDPAAPGMHGTAMRCNFLIAAMCAPCNGLDDGALHTGSSSMHLWDAAALLTGCQWQSAFLSSGYNLVCIALRCIALFHAGRHRCVIAFHKGPRLHALVCIHHCHHPGWCWFSLWVLYHSLQCVTIESLLCTVLASIFLCVWEVKCVGKEFLAAAPTMPCYVRGPRVACLPLINSQL